VLATAPTSTINTIPSTEFRRRRLPFPSATRIISGTTSSAAGSGQGA
jgi:hypothetical protein